jgi:hypothetical protein
MLIDDTVNYNKNDSSNKVKKENLTPETNIEYELFNIVSENGDSIYSLPTDKIMEVGSGQVYISLSEIKKIVNEELDKRLGSSLSNKND